MKKKMFDDKAREGAEYLLENFWLLRERDPQVYQLVREREDALRSFFMEKLGFQLIIHRHFAKLEKIPVEPETWMGIDTFKRTDDYSLFCCFMAYLESKNVEEQFLLSELCEEILGIYPEKEELDWTHYEHRKSLVRVLQKADELGVVKVVDGDIAGFYFEEGHEVLYQVPLLSRYFLRSYPKDLFQYNSMEEILATEWTGGDDGREKRHRVYRQLFLSPAMYLKEKNDADFLYLRNFRNRIREDVEKHSSFQFELYRNTAMLTLTERRALFTYFPDNKGIADIALHFAALVRRKKEEEKIIPQYDGSLLLLPVDFEKWVSECKKEFGHGWSKQYREAKDNQIVNELLSFLEEWKMAKIHQETGAIALMPLLARTTGKYPAEYESSGGKNGKNKIQ